MFLNPHPRSGAKQKHRQLTSGCRLSAVAAALVSVVNLTACVLPPQEQPVTLLAPFDQAQALAMLAPGTNTVKGSALMRQQGGGVVTCAGNQVVLVPATAYATERFHAIYGPNLDAAMARPHRIVFSPNPPGYAAAMHQAQCDAQGYFTFERVGDGVYYVTTPVSWLVGGVQQGGYLMKRLTLKGGETATAVLAPPIR